MLDFNFKGIGDKFKDKIQRLMKQINERNKHYAFSFIYPGEPASDVRPRKGMHGFYDPRSKEKRKMEKFIKTLLTEEDLPLAGKKGPVEELNVTFYITPPKKVTESKTKKFLYDIEFVNPLTRPDLDNYLKLLMDVGNDILWYDDSQCFNISMSKRYSQNPRTEVYMKYRKSKVDFRILNN